MLKTIRAKLTFTFIALLFINVFLLVSFFLYDHNTEKINKYISSFQNMNSNISKIGRIEKDFFNYELINPLFYETGRSEYAEHFDELTLTIKKQIDDIRYFSSFNSPLYDSVIHALDENISQHVKSFNQLVEKTRIRGYKDYGLVGKMRDDIHAVEDAEFPYDMASLLMIRRHEKDYLLRKEKKYTQRLDNAVETLINQIKDENATTKQGSRLIKLIHQYQETFHKMVEVDHEIGHHTGVGIRGELESINIRTEKITSRLQMIVTQLSKNRLNILELFFISVLVVGVFINLFLIFFVSGKLGKPVIKTSESIKEVIDSDFDREKEIYYVDSKDEIGQLSSNIRLMVKRVHERTDEVMKQKEELIASNTTLSQQKEEIMTQAENLHQANEEIRATVEALEMQKQEVEHKSKELEKLVEQLEDKNKLIQWKNKELEKLSIAARETENAIIIMDKDGNFEWVNKAFSKIFGFSMEKFIKERTKNIIGTNTPEDIKEIILNGIKNKETVHYELQTKTAQGKEIWLQATLTPYLDDNGEIVKLIAVDSDITKLKEYEADISSKKEEIERQNEYVIKQRDEIVERNKKIKDSIQYAKRIQNSLLAPFLHTDEEFYKHLIYFKPRDIVSGDFYWIRIVNGYQVFAAADCTGHGVPGAFMSILGVTILNDVVLKQEILEPDKALNEMRRQLKVFLSQTGSDDLSKDGIDIALCIINTKTLWCEYAGAFNPMYLIRDYNLQEFRADRMPVGIYPREKEFFTKQAVQLQKQDRIYLASDGFIDQIGEVKRKKFGNARFRQLLLDIHQKPVFEQYNILDDTFNKWKGKRVHVDDVVVLGIEIDK